MTLVCIGDDYTGIFSKFPSFFCVSLARSLSAAVWSDIARLIYVLGTFFIGFAEARLSSKHTADAVGSFM
ncbi:hypothetical protein [Candidatus Hydrogenosomobacter endosymbioticus]|uniref:Uncharacterized protein n=1 Tax=Candidatus Hydrogenosomobacter endosymbioticus TaxID=2558174 RepID=A0ABM7V9J0_9PROT|nr:hypothetical protein [Candidatus Hydrogenosomobacter endosymbioticus]BDB96476.1 hypothetical protein HYD_6090 [Candidatus Hydrogenosomobacter endosymbioticus]